MGLFSRKKKVEPTPPPQMPSEIDVKIKCDATVRQLDKFIAELKRNIQENAKLAADYKLAGLNAGPAIAGLAKSRGMLTMLTTMKMNIRQLQLNYKMSMMTNDIAGVFNGFSSLFSQTMVDDQTMAALTKNIFAMGDAISRSNASLDAINDVMSMSADSVDLSEAERQVDTLVSQSIEDSKIDPNMTAEALAEKITRSIMGNL